MQKYVLNLFLIALVTCLISSCSSTKMLDKDEKLLISNKFKYKEKKIYGKITLNPYVKQKPNSKFLIFPIGLWVYGETKKDLIDVFQAYEDLPKRKRNQHSLDSLYEAFGKPQYVGKKEWWARSAYKLGQPPVVVNEKNTQQTTRTLQNYFINKGYRHAHVSYEIKDAKGVIHANKKQRITYYIDAGKPTYIETYTKDIEDPEVRSIILDYDKKSRIKAGQILDEYALKNQINYYTSALRDNGYYKFNSSKENIYYVSDSTIDEYHYPLKLVVTTGDSLSRNFEKNYFGKVTTSLAPPKLTSQNEIEKKINCGENIVNNQEVLCNRYYNKRGIQFLKDTLIKVRTTIGETEFNKNKDLILEKIFEYMDEYGDKRKFTFYKNNVIMDPLVFDPNELYRESLVSKSKKNYFLLDNFNLIKGLEEVKLDSIYNVEDSSYVLRPSNFVNYNFQLTPKKRQKFRILSELNYSDFLKIGTTLGAEYFRRNIFRGGENLNTTMSMTLGTVSNSGADGSKSLFNAYDFSLQASIKFPRWLFFRKLSRREMKRGAPTSSILAGISKQNNIGLGRINYNTQLNYYLQPNRLTTHTLSLINLQYTNHLNPQQYYAVREKDNNTANTFINYYEVYNPAAQNWIEDGTYDTYSMINYIFQQDPDFVSYMSSVDPTLRSRMRYIYRNEEINTQNVLINSLLYNITFDQNQDPLNLNPWNLFLKFELAGTLLNLMDKAFSKNDNHEILGVKYSQFFKVEADIRKQQTFKRNSRLVGRLFFGVGIPLGATVNLPYDRNYIAGGANDVRAWKPFSLGPGDSKDEFSLGGLDNLKILSSLEWRFSLSETIEGALFTDVGNVWGTNKNYDYLFEFKNFYKQFGIGSGLGLRYNLGFFLVRLDWAFKIYNPKYSEGDRWNFHRIGFDKEGLSQTHLNFAIGYPF